MKSIFALLLAASTALPAFADNTAAPPKVDTARGQTLAAQICSTCHLVDGSRGAPAYPILTGQHPEYLAKQLADFKSGKRPNQIMQAFAASLSEADMRSVSALYAAKQPKPGTAKNKALYELGQKIFRGGIADKQVPACAGCHGPAGAGVPSQYPRVSGQHADYSEAQLVAFRSGQRANSVPMADVAARLSDREIKALADYMAGLR